MQQRKPLQSVSEIVDALGGPTKAGDAFETSPQNVVNWRKQGRLPARRFLTQRQILREHGFEVPAALWGMTEPENDKAPGEARA